MGDITVGDVNLRKEHIDPMVKGFALQAYKLKQVCMVESSHSWKNTYKIETAADLEGGTGSSIKGAPRGAKPAYAEVKWSEATKRHEKYMVEGKIDWEDIVTSDIPVVSRTLLRISRAVSKAVDDEIYTQISTNAGATVAAGTDGEWDSNVESKQDPLKNMFSALDALEQNNYDISNAVLIVNPTDYYNMIGNANIRNAGQFWTETPTSEGRVGKVAGITVIKTNSVTLTDKQAIVMIPKVACTWKSAHPLSSHTRVDEGIAWWVRAWEVGVTQVTNPDAICTITGIRL